MKRLLLAAIAACAVGAAAAAQAAVITPAYEYTDAALLTEGSAYTLGFAFSLGSAVTLDALGVWEDDLGHSHQVGIWDASNTLVASATVLSTDVVSGHFRWASVSPIVLAAGTYVIGAQYVGGSGGVFASDAQGVTTAPGFTWLGDRQTGGAGLNQPTYQNNNYGTNGIPYANLSFTGGGGGVPEPATWAMMIVGFGLAGAALRGRRTVTAA
jgi:hypothetical protein